MSSTKLFLFRNYGWIAAGLFFMALVVSAGFEFFGQDANWQVTITLLSITVSSTFLIQKQKLDESKLFKDLFQEFNKRYDDMNGRLQEIRGEEKALSEKDRALVVDYFNLCSEEHLFNEKGYIFPEVWEAWKNGMLFYMEDPRLGKLWGEEKKTDSYYGLEMLEVDDTKNRVEGTPEAPD